jgi:hypothetical protein
MPTGSGTTLPNAWTCLVSVIDFASGGTNGNSTASGKRLPLRVWHAGEQQNGDIYLIREKDVRRFILEHPTEIDLRKVDRLWFLDLLTNGLVRPSPVRN